MILEDRKIGQVTHNKHVLHIVYYDLVEKAFDEMLEGTAIANVWWKFLQHSVERVVSYGRNVISLILSQN